MSSSSRELVVDSRSSRGRSRFNARRPRIRAPRIAVLRTNELTPPSSPGCSQP